MKKTLLLTAASIIIFLVVLVALLEPSPAPFTNNRNLVEGDELRVHVSKILLTSELNTESLSDYIVSRGDEYITYLLPVGDYSLLKKERIGNEFVYRIVYIHVKKWYGI